jgi:protein-disulfide isomerase
MSDVVLKGAVVALATCACVLTANTLRHEMTGTKLPSGAEVKPRPVPLRNWRSFAIGGHRIGPESASVIVVEFADFECPFCAQFANGPLKAMQAKYPGKFAVLFRHWPLGFHRFALPTARAAECAARQSRFEQFHDLVYARQDSLGLKTYHDFGRDAGIPDLSAFDRCTTDTATVAAIVEDSRAAESLHANGTPTILINGMMIVGAPDTAMFEDQLKKAMAGSR